ncbi:sodium:solute symporter family protein [Bacillus shivajii]|uniref:sodium:solute symporter family protein n=1 Tax=Bacillus shivajii TaxID=1983719 RepID=UPI001CFBFE19|nr:sodium:solute symporter family protein [Bacillus shivajii]UCZ52888.1 sodium:solute symporter family protein [Bacillus shivajii]
MELAISNIDLGIIILYVIFSLFVGYWVSKSVGKFEDFAVAGRTFGPFMLAATFAATNFSTWSMVGKPGLVYGSGVPIAWIALNAMACVLAAVIFVPIYRKLRYNTMSEIFEDRYDGRVRGLISVIWILADTLNRYGVTVYAAAVITGLLFGVDIYIMILLIAALVLFYTYLGGLRSVVITDSVQFVLMFLGLFIGGAYIFYTFGGWGGLMSSVPVELTEWVPSMEHANGWPWIIAMTLLGFPYFITSQFVMQRGLAAKSVNIARWGMIFAAIVAIPIAILEVLPGLAAHSLLSSDAVSSMHSDMVGPQVYTELLPVGLLGIFFASLLAAGVSTADSALCGSSSLFTEDFYKKWKPNESGEHYLKVSRLTTVVLSVIGILWAMLVPLLGGAVDAILNVIAITDMPIFVIICLAIFWRQMKATAAVIAILAGTISGLTVSILGAGGIQGLAVTTATSTFTTLIVGVILSLIISRDNKEEQRVSEFFEKIANTK